MAARDLTAGAELRLRAQRRRIGEDVVKGVLAVCALISVATTVGIVVALFVPAFEFFQEVSIVGFLTGTDWAPLFEPARFGVLPLITGTLLVTAIASAVAMPLGLGAAIYLSEYARPRVRSALKPVLEVLAGVPSVVLGFFALNWIAPNLVGRFFGEEYGRGGSMLAAGIGVGILSIPLVASVSEDAMRAVPGSLREASAGLGARKMATTVRVVLPAAESGLVAAMILATSRAIGETMVVFIAGGATNTAQYTLAPTDSSLTMTAAMASLATGTDSVRGAGLAVPSLYFVGIALFVITLGLNLVADRFVRRVRQAY